MLKGYMNHSMSIEGLTREDIREAAEGWEIKISSNSEEGEVTLILGQLQFNQLEKYFEEYGPEIKVYAYYMEAIGNKEYVVDGFDSDN